jgi:hypothetical protein
LPLIGIKAIINYKQIKMKTIVKTLMAILLGTSLSGSIMTAQGQTQSKQPGMEMQKMKPVLTEEQKTMLKNNRQKRKDLWQAFRATFSQKQKDMLSDPRLMPYERMKSFRASLTDQQVDMIKANRKEIKAMKDEFRSTLSDEQKIQFRKMAVNRGRMNRVPFEKAIML